MTNSQAEERRPLITATRGSYNSADIELQEGVGETRRGNGICRQEKLATGRDRLTYSWREVNVRTVEPAKKTRSIGRRIRKAIRGDDDAGTPPAVGRHILRNVTGIAFPGEVTVIMGSSGAGKTTLLNALTFRTKSNTTVAGERYLNGYPVGSATMTALSAYVQQEELFLNSLTVREHLTFQAMVRMEEGVTPRQRTRRVDEVIDELGLRRCEHTVIRGAGDSSGISGGERKRLSFASEVLTDPPMMFCDEPTSGLDSVMALNVVSVLKAMAKKGKTVVCTIHQPSSEMYSMFDRIVLLAEGRVAFFGSRDEAADFFAGIGVPCPLTYNPADFYIQLLAVVPFKEESCRETIAAVCDSFEGSPAGVKLSRDVGARHALQGDLKAIDEYPKVGTRTTPYRVGWRSQFRAVLWRSWLCVIKDPILVRTRLFQNLVVSLMISVLYFQQKNNEDSIFNVNGVIFTFLTNMTFQNVFAVITVFCSERPIFLREHFSGMYRVDVYFLSKTLAEIPIFLALPVMFVVVTYYSVGLNPGIDHFFLAILIVVLVANVATSFGYFVSSISSSVTMALSIGPPVIISFLLFGGFLLNVGSIPDYFHWFSYLSWFRYGNEALLINQWLDVDNIECRTLNSTCPRSGKLVLEIFNFRPEHFNFDLILLFLLIMFFRLLAFLALLSTTFRK